MTVNARTEEFQQLELFGKYALFTDGRIDRPTVPKGWHCNDFRGSDDDPDELCYTEFETMQPEQVVLCLKEAYDRLWNNERKAGE